jgi:hypothetical protein
MRYDVNLPSWKWPFYVARHPFEGFEDLRWKKAYDAKVALVIVAAFFIINVCESLMTGFLFNTHYVKVFNIVPYFSSSVILFFTWVVGNWALCTLFNGEGTMKSIMCVSAYALVPYLITQVLCIIASNVITAEEYMFLLFFRYIGTLWSCVLMVSGIKTVHQYTIPKTILAIFATILAMVVILFFMVLLVALFQQVYTFVYSIYTELMYRFSEFEPLRIITITLLVIAGITATVLLISFVARLIQSRMKLSVRISEYRFKTEKKCYFILAWRLCLVGLLTAATVAFFGHIMGAFDSQSGVQTGFLHTFKIVILGIDVILLLVNCITILLSNRVAFIINYFIIGKNILLSFLVLLYALGALKFAPLDAFRYYILYGTGIMRVFNCILFIGIHALVGFCFWKHKAIFWDKK